MADKPNMTDIRDLANALSPPTPTYPPSVLRKGTVVAISPSSPPVLTITLAGDDTELEEIAVMSNYAPQVGDVVLLNKSGASLTAIGAASSAQGWTNVSLGTGWAHGSELTQGGPVQYRSVLDQGSWKMQWRGIANRTSGSNTGIASLSDPEHWPSYKRMCSSQTNGLLASGTNSVRLSFNIGGTITIGGSATNNRSQFPDWVTFDSIEYYL